MSQDELRWRTPPESRKVYDWSSIADGLKANPREWVCVFEHDRSSVAHAIRIGSIAAIQPVWSARPEDERRAGFEMTTRNNTRENPRMCDLYLRYLPPKRKRKR